ncbi:eukaryotic translation initiation factor 3 subunit F [Elysia marginata]|uniref:Eukaryotic translation initiation factor 3 subunit F n=1 Tax=Elysia marginata TaxID=1093978 RepID=A0AAV4FPN4_9GAST|nr:eukaryotic translation initiation factor 3 subunit F [Elysia marginata]
MVQKKIQTFEMWCYRRLLKVPWTEKKTNKEIIQSQKADVGKRLLQQLMKRKLSVTVSPQSSATNAPADQYINLKATFNQYAGCCRRKSQIQELPVAGYPFYRRVDWGKLLS